MLTRPHEVLVQFAVSLQKPTDRVSRLGRFQTCESAGLTDPSTIVTVLWPLAPGPHRRVRTITVLASRVPVLTTLHPLAPRPTEHKIPRGARFLSVQVQDGAANMWFLVDTERPLETRHFVVYGTGHEIKIPKNFLKHLGTFQFPGLVFHAFEDTPKEGS